MLSYSVSNNKRKGNILLVLTRKEKDIIIINGNIKVCVLGVNNHGQYRIGIDAPQNISVDRQEIHEKKESEK